MILSAGVDEAGRGSGVAEIYVCATILDPKKPIAGLNDSKKLTAGRRRELTEIIKERALAWSLATAGLEEIEGLNVLGATLLAMKRAVEGLSVLPDKVLIDGNRAPAIDIPTETIIKGDVKIPEISAASIVAKVERDLAMMKYHELYPEYGFDVHKGYFTKSHLAALDKYGPCPIHRKTYAPVKRLLDSV